VLVEKQCLSYFPGSDGRPVERPAQNDSLEHAPRIREVDFCGLLLGVARTPETDRAAAKPLPADALRACHR
jgi:hypothetical protein